MSKKMIFAKCNYEIYDKKFLVIIKTFEKWRFECVDISIENSIKILIDHHNFKYFITSKNFNKKQTRWAEFLFEFNFLITFRANKKNTKTNNFTRKIENLFANEENERKKHNHKKLLKKKHLNKKIRKVVELISMLLNESFEKIIWLTALMYDLNEKKSVVKKSIEKLTAENAQKKKTSKKSTKNCSLTISTFNRISWS